MKYTSVLRDSGSAEKAYTIYIIAYIGIKLKTRLAKNFEMNDCSSITSQLGEKNMKVSLDLKGTLFYLWAFAFFKSEGSKAKTIL